MAAAAAAGEITLTAAGKGRFAGVEPRVFHTSANVAIVYQLSEVPGGKPPIVILGGGLSTRLDSCMQHYAESAAFADRTVLIFDRRNTGASDVDYRDIGTDCKHASENHAQAADIAELLTALGLGPYVLYGHSSGARLFGMLAISHPTLVRALVLCILTGGKRAAKTLGKDYYLRYAAMAEKGGMEAVLADPLYAAGARVNKRVEPYLRSLEPSSFVDVMKASAAFYMATKGEPALGLPAASLATLRMPALLVYNKPPDVNDGMHTKAVMAAVAEAIPSAGEPVVSHEPEVWFGAVERFVERHGAAAAGGEGGPGPGEPS